MIFNKTGLEKALNEDNSIIGEYTNFQIQGNTAIIETTKDFCATTKEINIHELTWLYKDFLFKQNILIQVWQTTKGWVIDLNANLKGEKRNFWREPMLWTNHLDDYGRRVVELPYVTVLVNGREVQRQSFHQVYHKSEFDALCRAMDWFLKNEDNLNIIEDDKKEEIAI